MKDWAKYCKSKGMRTKQFSRDFPIRWNSTYELFNDSNDYKKLLCDFIANNIGKISLYPHQWDACTNILDILNFFNDSILSGIYYVTTYLFLIECINICGVME